MLLLGDDTAPALAERGMGGERVICAHAGALASHPTQRQRQVRCFPSRGNGINHSSNVIQDLGTYGLSKPHREPEQQKAR